jgi:mono/diheme cytochrome c family protein
MNRALHRLTLTAACFALSATLFAGGWAVVTLDTLPERMRAGEPITLGYTVRQHGVRLLDGLNGAVEASAGSHRVKTPARWDGRPGHYVATLTIPEPGQWSITIQSGFGGQGTLSLLPLEVQEPAARPAAEASSARGQRLFVAKGCATCHRVEGKATPVGVQHGPPLVPRKFQADYLARILRNPAVLPPTKHYPFRMPELGLDPPDIDALVAFINGAEHSSPGASQNRQSR